MASKKDKEEKPISKSKKIYNVVSTVIVALIFVFLVVVVAFMLVQRKEGKDVSIFGYYTFNVLTDSMKDTIYPGDVIIGKEVDPQTLEQGDIITFIAPSGQLAGRNITHRIYEVHRGEDGKIDYFKTKGDNAKVDEWHLDPSAVKAKYVKTSKFITGFRKLLTKWYGYVVLIVLPLCVVFALVIAGFVQDKVALEKEKKNDEDKQKLLDNLSDEEKQKLLESYLNSNGINENAGDDGNADETVWNGVNENKAKTDSNVDVETDAENVDSDSNQGAEKDA